MPPATAAAVCAAAGAITSVLGAATGFAAGGRDVAASTSALTIRPWGPLPVMDFRSTPASAAMRRASGLAKTRSPLAAAGAVVVAGAAGLAEAAGGVGAAAGAGGFGAAAA